mmetsp:Transcript_29434/g.59348  ORF Transcript_29434/g.59348 Transcript_29434/m.59348 type:complete len:207 (+) Transcript_29434:211-831(+)
MSLLSFFLYSRMSPFQTSTFLCSHSHTSRATCPMSRKSCETSTSPPLNALIASASESIDSMSKWFVGSSRKRMCGVHSAMYANTRRDFCPSDMCRIGCVCISPETPKRPTLLRQASISSFFSGNMAAMYSSGVLSMSSWSVECWWYLAIRKCECFFTSPLVGVSSPNMSFSSVDFPAPLGPMRAIRESRSTDSSRLRYSMLASVSS